jgi:16S rRNA (cytosine967-C5)-methyltransferase
MNHAKEKAINESSRALAVEILGQVDAEGGYANLLLSQRLRTVKLSSSDAGFLTELVSGTLRERQFYDAVIEQASQRPTDSIDPLTLNILRTGAHQLLTLHTGAHAAVNESVELQRALGKQSATGFVNGVLRTLSRQTREGWMEQLLLDISDDDVRLSVVYSHPVWIVRAFRDALRLEDRENELESLLAADNTNPKVSIAVLPGAEIDIDRFAALLDEGTVLERGPSPIGFEMSGGNPARVLRDRSLANEESIRVQDQGSQLAALALIHAPVTTSSESQRWVDLCSGPGGKTAILAAAAEQMGAKIRAIEKVEHRAQLVRQAVRAHSAVVSVKTADGTGPDALGDELYDRILVDAPCTGLGALRRRPESRSRKAVSDVAALTQLQSKLLANALQHLKPGGVVAYVTCSPHLAETRAIVDRALRESGDIEELDAKEVLQEIAGESLDLAGENSSVQLWPHRHETDAMFIALLQRRLEL